MPHTLTADDVRKVARLARLKLTPAEVDAFARQLGDVLAYVDQLGEIDTSQVAPLAHPIELQNVLRPDEPAASLPRNEALGNAPKTDGRYFLVPQIIETE